MDLEMVRIPHNLWCKPYNNVSLIAALNSFKVTITLQAKETGKGPASESSTKKKGRTVVITTEDMQKRRNDVKARTTLLLALLDEHQLRFSSETLEQTFNRLQDIVSHLEFMDVEIEQEDLNQKFLTSLAPEWQIGKGEVHTASVPTASTQVSTASTDVAVASLSHDTIYQGSSKRMKTSEDVSEEDLKGMIQLVPLEEVYVEVLQVKRPIIDWEIHSKRKREYWKIIRLGGHTAVYQFFVDILKQFDRQDLHQLWTLVKETFSIKQATKDKEKELCVELKRLFEPDFEDQL
nr:hypothetical protein [Tanacetum cinerariifolium]